MLEEFALASSVQNALLEKLALASSVQNALLARTSDGCCWLLDVVITATAVHFRS